jgi:carboxyl-terminal processing protease
MEQQSSNSGDEAGMGDSASSTQGNDLSGARIKKVRVTVLALVLIFTTSLGYSIGYLVSKNQRPTSIVDQAIARVSSGDPHSPTEILLQRAAIEAVLKATKDRWSNYFPPTSAIAFDATLQGRYSGIGIWLRRNLQNKLEISSVQPKSPASHAGLEVSDQLLTVDGATISDASVADGVAALRGGPNTAVTLGLRRSSGDFSAVLRRAAVLTGDVLASQVAPKTLYIQISAISLHAADDVATA